MVRPPLVSETWGTVSTRMLEQGRWAARARYRDVDGRTRLIQEFDIHGIIPNIAARIFGMGSYKGSFQGELEAFKAIAEREASGDGRLAGQDGGRDG